MNELKDYILVLENIIPENLCEDILNEYINSNEWQYASIRGNNINKEVRNCTQINVSSEETINKNLKIRKRIDDNIFDCTKEVIKKYNQKFKNCYVFKDLGYTLLKYEKNGFYKQHTDSMPEIPRAVSCSFILNDGFKGGEFSFFDNKTIHLLKKGSAIIFPSNFLYPHSILPVIKGTRYSIVTWFI
jgi:predicted 2-oxoglutarate/Fe(II)-dependent dioxygenase YbiX